MTRPSVCPKKQQEREELAASMAAWEAINGAVVTVSFQPPAAPTRNFNNQVIVPPVVEAKKRSPARNLPKAKIEKIERMYKKPLVEVAMDLAKSGLNIRESAEKVGLSAQYYAKLIQHTPSHALYFPPKDQHVVEGVSDSLSGHCKRYGMFRSTVARRLKYGETLAQALDIDPSPRSLK